MLSAETSSGPRVKDYDVNAFAPADDSLRGQLTEWPKVRAFMFAGNARFTLRSAKTGCRYTYQVKAKKEELQAAQLRAEHKRADNSNSDPTLPDIDVTYFVSLLRGSDNVADYKYLGVLRKPGTFYITPASRLPRTSPSMKALIWFLDVMRLERTGLGKTLEFWHEGRCARCSRLLTVPKSINDAAFNGGYGPECAKYFGGGA